MYQVTILDPEDFQYLKFTEKQSTAQDRILISVSLNKFWVGYAALDENNKATYWSLSTEGVQTERIFAMIDEWRAKQDK